MAFDLDIPPHITAYLDGLEVSPGVRQKIADALEMIENLPAEHRANAANRYPNSTLLRYSYAFMDEDRRIHTITLGIDDSPAIYGVLRVPHAKYTTGGVFPPPASPPP